MRTVFRRPSPAMVVAIIALIAALCGSALAGGVLTKKKVKKVANNVVTQRAPGLSVASAKSADSATTANAIADPSLQIRGWARVNSAGAIVDSRNINGAHPVDTGSRCIDTPFAVTGAAVEIDGGAAGSRADDSTAVIIDNASSTCEVEVFIRNQAGFLHDSGFYLLVH